MLLPLLLLLLSLQLSQSRSLAAEPNPSQATILTSFVWDFALIVNLNWTHFGHGLSLRFNCNRVASLTPCPALPRPSAPLIVADLAMWPKRFRLMQVPITFWGAARSALLCFCTCWNRFRFSFLAAGDFGHGKPAIKTASEYVPVPLLLPRLGWAGLLPNEFLIGHG